MPLSLTQANQRFIDVYRSPMGVACGLDRAYAASNDGRRDYRRACTTANQAERHFSLFAHPSDPEIVLRRRRGSTRYGSFSGQ